MAMATFLENADGFLYRTSCRTCSEMFFRTFWEPFLKMFSEHYFMSLEHDFTFLDHSFKTLLMVCVEHF